MSNKLFIAAAEARSGKSAVALGVMEMLLKKVNRVGFFRPIIQAGKNNNAIDNDIDLISKHFNLGIPYDDMYAYTTTDAHSLLTRGKGEELIEGILNKYSQLSKIYDFVLCEGTDFLASTASFEFDINAEIIKNLGSPVLLVSNTHQKSIDEAMRNIELSLEALYNKGCDVIGTVVNRASEKDMDIIARRLRERDLTKQQLIYTIPNEETLGNPTVGEIAQALNAKVLWGEEQLDRFVCNITVAAMQIRNFLPRIEPDSLIITPGDRADVIVACLAAVSSTSFPDIAGIVLTGGLLPEEPITRLIKGFSRKVPILSVQENTFPAARTADAVHTAISPKNAGKITQALALFEKHVNVKELSDRIITVETRTVTPKMFEHGLLQKARSDKQHVVLPEGEEERILRAAEILIRREVVDITLLGNEEKIRERIRQLGLQLDGIRIIEPQKSEWIEEFAQTYKELRKHKGTTIEAARSVMTDVNYFGTMMVHKGYADGMVSGSVHTTASTIRPAFEIIKTKPGASVVSSVFFMCLSDRVLTYGDCAINPNPNAEQLAEIAITSAQTARIFGIEPLVAMLSYSTGESGRGDDVNLIREATRIARERSVQVDPGLKIEGPIQYDAATDAAVAKTKMPDSEVAGRATVFIFPDLNAGNNAYKAVQRSSGAVAIGPVLQGLNHPVNDLSRGCTITDIVNTVAITAVQAQSEKAKKTA